METSKQMLVTRDYGLSPEFLARKEFFEPLEDILDLFFNVYGWENIHKSIELSENKCELNEHPSLFLYDFGNKAYMAINENTERNRELIEQNSGYLNINVWVLRNMREVSSDAPLDQNKFRLFDPGHANPDLTIMLTTGCVKTLENLGAKLKSQTYFY